nr:MFS transporter [Ornithinimicrobium sp. HY1745]
MVTLVTVGSVLPVFLLGANGPTVMAELNFDARGIGAAAGSYTAGMAITSLVLGRWLDRWTISQALAVSLGLVSIGGIVTAVATTLIQLALGLSVCGVGSSAVQMAGGRVFGRLVGTGHGAAFGWFQSAKPVAVALAGGFGLLAVLGLDWRWTFLLVTGATLAPGAILVRWSVQVDTSQTEQPPRVGMDDSLILLAVLMGVGFGLTNISTTFIPDTVAAADGDSGWASLLLVIGGTLAAVSRVLAGRWTDRTGWDELRLIGPAFMAAGIGSMLISTLTWSGILIGCLLVFALGWSFGGLLIAKGTRCHPAASAQVIGLLLLGGAIGGSAAPPLFGMIATSWGYDTAWFTWGALILAIGALCVWHHRMPGKGSGVT